MISTDLTRQQSLEILYSKRLNSKDQSIRDRAQELIDLMYRSSDIPSEVIEFISQNDDNYLKQYLSLFMDEMSSKKFYKNLRLLYKGERLDYVNVSKTLTSLITHALIDVDKGKISLSDAVKILRLDEFSEILNEYLRGGTINMSRVYDLSKSLFSGGEI